jgi:hypothetical protein
MFDYHLDLCMLLIWKILSLICSFFNQFAMLVPKRVPLSELYRQCELVSRFFEAYDIGVTGYSSLPY